MLSVATFSGVKAWGDGIQLCDTAQNGVVCLHDAPLRETVSAT